MMQGFFSENLPLTVALGSLLVAVVLGVGAGGIGCSHVPGDVSREARTAAAAADDADDAADDEQQSSSTDDRNSSDADDAASNDSQNSSARKSSDENRTETAQSGDQGDDGTSTGNQSETSSSSSSSDSESKTTAEKIDQWSDDCDAANSAGWQKACKKLRKLAMQQFQKKATCDNIEKVWEKYEYHLGAGPGEAARRNFGKAAVKAYKECGKKDFVWEQLVHWGNDRVDNGYGVLAVMESSGLAPVDEFFAYLKRHKDDPMSFNNAEYAALHIGAYFTDQEKFDQCGKLKPYLEEFPGSVFRSFSEYLREAECTEVAPAVTRFLADDGAGVRLAACKTLGEIGTSAQVGDVRSVAENDSAFRWERGSKVYFVRDACRRAARKM
ncbi:MAG: HEAT repeat domain-containing protein [Bradymonadaceae bacterium]